MLKSGDGKSEAVLEKYAMHTYQFMSDIKNTLINEHRKHAEFEILSHLAQNSAILVYLAVVEFCQFSIANA